MVKRTGPTNPLLKSAIESFRRKGSERSQIWEDVAEKLSKPTRSRVEVNLSQIDRYANGNEFVVVPGVVLSSGEISKPVNVAAWRFSANAEKKIKSSGGKVMTIEQLKKENPKGTNVRIMV